MEYTSLAELYQFLIPAFNVKKRLLKFNNSDLTDEDIWQYLAVNKWKSSINLTISDMVNDIITVDIHKITKFKGGE